MNKKHLFFGALYIIMAAGFLFCEASCREYSSLTYHMTPILITDFIFPLLLGVILCLSEVFHTGKKEAWVLLIINAAIILVLWKIMPGRVSIFNLLLMGVLIPRLIKKRDD